MTPSAHGPLSDVFEIGLNHLGSRDRAAAMVEALRAQGASCISLQVLTDPHALTRDRARADALRPYCMTLLENLDLVRHAVQAGAIAGAAVLDPRDVEPLVGAGASFLKILSADLTFEPLISEAASTGLPVFLSAAAAVMEEVADALTAARRARSDADIRLIHTNLGPPVPIDRLDLRHIRALSDQFGVPVSYGEHSDDHRALELAIAAGAESVFAYVAIERDPRLPDGPHALLCSDVGAVLARLTDVRRMLGEAAPVLDQRQRSIRRAIRRSIVAVSRINAGEAITRDRIAFRQPGTGLSPALWRTIIGQIAPQDIDPGEDVWPAFYDPRGETAE